MNTENIKENVERVVEDLTRLRDEGRVRLNLLGKELRDRWAEIERQVEEIARQARDASGAALDRARELRDDLRRELGKGKEPPPSSPGP
jgi:molybdenum-dependent DNA-binding transcriptional regulator ModE